MRHRFLSEIANENLQYLQKAIARGENTRAVKYAALFPHLLEKKCGVTDYSHRNFMPLFPLQLAAYYQNTPLCEALCEYLPEEIARDQLNLHDAQGLFYTRHDNPGMFISERYFSEKDLLEKLQRLIDCDKKSPEIKHRALIALRREQLMLPPHAAMWYCTARNSQLEVSETTLQIPNKETEKKYPFYEMPEGYAAFGLKRLIPLGVLKTPPTAAMEFDFSILEAAFNGQGITYSEFYMLKSGADLNLPIKRF